MKIATERGRLPLNVMWIDQEAEWDGTVDHCTEILTRPDVNPYWFQMPMVITNNASVHTRYLHCWEKSREGNWVHPKHPLSHKENIYGTERFHELFEAIMNVEFKGKKACNIGGVRTEEAPKRLVGLTSRATYKWITWGRIGNKRMEHYTFYPIYDWSYTDVWKAIHSNGWPYNRIYDRMYQYGLTINQMRVSNLHHETAKQNLQYVQEIEPETWERVAPLIEGANTINQLHKASYSCPRELPYMFASWHEYVVYLAENLVPDEKNRATLLENLKTMGVFYSDPLINKRLCQTLVDTILSSDWDWTLLINFLRRPDVFGYRRWKQGNLIDQRIPLILKNPFVPSKAKQVIMEEYRARTPADAVARSVAV